MSITEVFKNTSWLLVSQIITSIFGFFWIVLLARYLGVSDFGIINFAISFSTLISIFTDLGINIYVTRDLSRYPELSQQYIGNAIPLKIILSLLSFIATLAILGILNYNLLTIQVVLLFALHVIFLNMCYLFNGVFQAYGKMKYQAIGIIINSSLVLIGTCALIFFNLGLIAVGLAYISGSLISLIYLYFKVKDKITNFKLKVDFDFWKKSIKSSIPFGITNVFTIIYYLIDTVMLSFMVGSVAVGIYSSAYKIITVFIAIYTVYNFVVFPLMSKFYKNSGDLLKTSYEKSVKYLLMMMLPIAIGITIYAPYITTLIYGEAYILGADVLRILIWNVLFVMINGAATSLLNSSNREVVVTKINGIACLINILFNLVAIYYLSYIGASITTVITGVVICVIMVHVISKEKYKPDISLVVDIIKIVISGLILGVILVLTNLNFWIAIPVAIIIYLISLHFIKALDETDKAILKEIIGR